MPGRAAGTGAPLLTVLVPTRNRWSLLSAQAKSLQVILEETGIDFEVVIHDNSTEPPPVGLVEGFPECARYIRSPETFDTAEENICEAIRHCRGEYVWLLADDDGVERSGLAALVAILSRGEQDIIVFNSRHGRDERLAGDGPYVTERARRIFFESEMSCDIATFVERTGFYYWICAISTVIVRRSIADPAVLSRYLQIARIYAHVAWLIEIGKNRRFLFVNRPLVVYGLLPTDHDGGRHWRSVGVREGGYSNSVWTGLWLRVLEELVGQQALSIGQIRRVVDMNHSTRFHFGSNFAHQALEQLGEMIEPTPIEDLKIMSRWLRLLFPGAIFMTALIDDIAAFVIPREVSLVRIEQDSRFNQAERAMARDLRARAAWWRRAIGETAWYSHFYVETLGLYDVYDFGSDWVAAHVSFGALRESLEIIDLPSVPPAFFRAATYEALRALVKAEAPTPEGLALMRSASLQLPNEWTRLRPEPPGVRVEVLPTGPAPPAPTITIAAPVAAPSGEGHLRSEVARLDAELAQIYASNSWRLTGWLRRLRSPPRQQGASLAADLVLGERIFVSEESAAAYLVRGFSSAEPWGRWTDGSVAVFRCRHPACNEPGLLEVWPEMVWDAGGSRSCVVDVVVNRRKRARKAMRTGECVTLPLPISIMASSELEVVFNILQPKTAEEPPVGDERALGVGIGSIRLSRRSDASSSP